MKGSQKKLGGAIFTAGGSLFETAEETRPGKLNGLASMILAMVVTSSGQLDYDVTKFISQYMESLQQIVDPLEQNRRSIQILNLIFVFLDITLTKQENMSAVSLTLAGIASQKLRTLDPGLLDMGKFAHFVKVLMYLRDQSAQQGEEAGNTE